MTPTADRPPLLRIFRAIALAEGVSFLVLLGIAMPLKYVAGIAEAVQVTGWLHGLLFIAYMALGPLLFTEASWPLRRVPGFVLAAVLPFGTFVMERRWLRP